MKTFLKSVSLALTLIFGITAPGYAAGDHLITMQQAAPSLMMSRS